MKFKMLLGAIIVSTLSISSYAETYTSEQVSRAIDRNLQSATAGDNYTSKDIQSMRMMLLNQANYAADEKNKREALAKKKNKNKYKDKKSKYKRQSLLQAYKERAKKSKNKRSKSNEDTQKPFSSMDNLRRVNPDSIR